VEKSPLDHIPKQFSIQTRDQISFAEQSHLIKRFNEVTEAGDIFAELYRIEWKNRQHSGILVFIKSSM